MSTPPIDKLAAAAGQTDLAPESALELLVALTEEEDAEIRRHAPSKVGPSPGHRLRFHAWC